MKTLLKVCTGACALLLLSTAARPAELTPMALGAHQRMVDEKPPLDGHHKNILDPAHTHVGVGLAVVGGEFALGQLFLNRYIKLGPLPDTLAAGVATLRVAGEVLAAGY